MNTKGFQLIELLVVIAIFTALAAVIIPGYRTGQRNTALRQGARMVESALRDAQSRAVNGATIKQGSNDVLPRGGYGVNFAAGSDEIKVFADLTSDTTVNVDMVVDTVRLPDKVTIGNVAKPNIIFTPITGDVYTGNPWSSCPTTVTVGVALNGAVARTVVLDCRGKTIEITE